MSASLPFGIQRVGFRKMPHVPTPTERMQQYRMKMPVQFANTTFPGTQPAIAIPCKPHSPAAVGWVPTFPDPPAWDEVVTDYALRRGD